MKKVFFISFLLFSVAFTFGQSSQETMGSNAGCNDGIQTAYSPSYLNTLYSIMNNDSISIEYKEAYYEAFYTCRSATLRGQPISGGLTDFVKCNLWGDNKACEKIKSN